MRGGQNRRSTEAKQLAGTLRKHRETRDAKGHEPLAKVPAPPPGLSKIEREVWTELAGQVEARRSYTATRRTSFRLMVSAVARVRGARREPAYAFEKLLRAANEALRAFGIAPLRAELPPVVPEAEDEAEKFFFGGPLRAVEGGKGE